jgi:hemerythrin-like metal-binding protein
MSLSISAATEEQTTNARQVSKAVENVNELTQSAASSAEEMSAATGQLSMMAQELQRLVGQFKIDGHGSGANAKSNGDPTDHAAIGNEPAGAAAPAAGRKGLPLPSGSAGGASTSRGSFFVWSEGMSVKVPSIDEQHKRLVVMIDALHQEMLERRGQEAQRKTIEEMVDYAATHFTAEEEYMHKFGFPGTAQHVKAHEEFTAKACELKERAEGAGFILTAEILDFLKDWLQRHIMGMDRQYITCFVENGAL